MRTGSGECLHEPRAHSPLVASGALLELGWFVNIDRYTVRVERPEAVHAPIASSWWRLDLGSGGDYPLIHLVHAGDLEADGGSWLLHVRDGLHLNEFEVCGRRGRDDRAATHVRPLLDEGQADHVSKKANALVESHGRDHDDCQIWTKRHTRTLDEPDANSPLVLAREHRTEFGEPVGSTGRRAHSPWRRRLLGRPRQCRGPSRS